MCFVNLYTGKFFRNRDAIGLMRRFGREGREREGKDGDGGAGIGVLFWGTVGTCGSLCM